MNSVKVESLEQLRSYAEALAPLLPLGSFIGFSGELGTGKTALIREIARALGFPGEVTSPTYGLEHIYPLPDGLKIHHWDLYRLQDGAHSEPLEELLGRKDALILIEWP